MARLAGLVRLTHPYPSLLNGLITAALAIVAGASVPTATRLGLAMLALQVSIGTLNDLVDAPLDAGRKLRKPIPANLVGVGEARLLVGAALAVGLGLAAPSGLPALVVAIAGVCAGYLYDLRLKGSAVSWVPFAVGIPLLPVFAWVGATGSVPATFLIVLPLAALAGAGIAIGNAMADHERDLDSGTASVATRLGLHRAWQVHAVIHLSVVVAAIAAGSAVGEGAPGATLGSAGAGLVILAGVAMGRGGGPGRRELAWEVEAAGTGLLAIVWLLGVSSGA